MGRSRKLKKRKIAKRYSGDRVLIVCEGTETEPNYLNALKEHFKLNSIAVEVAPSRGSAPSSIVKYAKEKILEACRKGDPYAKAYCVFDKDQHSTYNGALQAIRNYSPVDHECQTILCAIPSVPCFEYWILVHFVQTTRNYGTSGHSPCKQLISTDLSTRIAGYSKTDEIIAIELINTRLNTAKTNARATLLTAQRAGTDDPSTKMHLLVEELEHLRQYNYFQENKKECPDEQETQSASL